MPKGPSPLTLEEFRCTQRMLAQSLVARAAFAHQTTQEAQIIHCEGVASLAAHGAFIILPDTEQLLVQTFVFPLIRPNCMAGRTL